jgi:hypothetical protein
MLNAIDEDTEALRQRVNELKKTIDRMNEQLLREEAKAKAAEEARVASVPAAPRVERDWRDDWMAMGGAAVALVVGLTAGALWAGRRSRTARHAAHDAHDAPILDGASHALGATRSRGLAAEPSILAHSDLEAHFDEDVLGARTGAKSSLSR